MRIPLWPGVRLSVWEKQNPDAVQVTATFVKLNEPVHRVLSMRGWMLLLARYDWKDRTMPDRPDHRELEELRAKFERIRAEVSLLCDCCGNSRERMGRIRAELGLDTEGYFREDGEGL